MYMYGNIKNKYYLLFIIYYLLFIIYYLLFFKDKYKKIVNI